MSFNDYICLILSGLSPALNNSQVYQKSQSKLGWKGTLDATLCCPLLLGLHDKMLAGPAAGLPHASHSWIQMTLKAHHRAWLGASATGGSLWENCLIILSQNTFFIYFFSPNWLSTLNQIITFPTL